MNKELRRIIDLFNGAQKRAVEVLEREYGCSRPSTPLDFIFRCVPAIRSANYESGVYRIRPHGGGMDVTLGDVRVDFDFGGDGEFNQFDSWWLFQFVEMNKLPTSIESEYEMEALIQEAVLGGYVVQESSNSYVIGRQDY